MPRSNIVLAAFHAVASNFKFERRILQMEGEGESPRKGKPYHRVRHGRLHRAMDDISMY